MNKIIKLCCFCNNFHLSFETEDYSEVTPGENAEIGCTLGYWTMGNSYITDLVSQHPMEEYRRNIHKAINCDNFDPVKEMNPIKKQNKEKIKKKNIPRSERHKK